MKPTPHLQFQQHRYQQHRQRHQDLHHHPPQHHQGQHHHIIITGSPAVTASSTSHLSNIPICSAPSRFVSVISSCSLFSTSVAHSLTLFISPRSLHCGRLHNSTRLHSYAVQVSVGARGEPHWYGGAPAVYLRRSGQTEAGTYRRGPCLSGS